MLKLLLKFCIWIRSVTLVKFLLKYTNPSDDNLLSAIATENKEIVDLLSQEIENSSSIIGAQLTQAIEEEEISKVSFLVKCKKLDDKMLVSAINTENK